jgi:hypothetical protein
MLMDLDSSSPGRSPEEEGCLMLHQEMTETMYSLWSQLKARCYSLSSFPW